MVIKDRNIHQLTQAEESLRAQLNEKQATIDALTSQQADLESRANRLQQAGKTLEEKHKESLSMWMLRTHLQRNIPGKADTAPSAGNLR